MEVKQEFQWGVAIITFKDLCDWLDYENNVGGKWLQYLALEEFLNISFPIFLKAPRANDSVY